MKTTPKILVKLAERLGFQTQGAAVFGRVGTHWFSLTSSWLSPDNVSVFTGFDGVDDEKQQVLRSFFQKARAQFQADLVGLDGTSARFSFHRSVAKDRVFVERIASFLEAADAFLNAQGVGAGCYFCGADGSHPMALHAGTNPIEVCGECFGQLEEAARKRDAEGGGEGSYWTGFAGAALGGLAGIVPWVLIGRLGYVTALCGLFTAWISAKLYRAFRGKAGRGMPWIIGLCVAVSVLLSTSVSVFVSALVDEAMAPMDALVGTLMFPFFPEALGFYWGQVGLGLLFAALGSWGVLRNLSREGTGAHLKIERI